MKAKINCRIVYTVGGKGGVGKSWTVSQLTDYYSFNNIKHVLFDCDDETSSTSRLFPKSAKFLAIRSASEIDHLVQTATEGKVAVVLVDLPARSGDEFQNWFSIVPWDELVEHGIRFTSIGVVSGAKDSLEAILRWNEFLGINVDQILALNRRDNLSIYETSKARDKFRSENIMEIEIPKLDERFAAALDRANWPISTALASSEPHFLTQIMSRARLRRYRDQVFTQFETIKHLLIP